MTIRTLTSTAVSAFYEGLRDLPTRSHTCIRLARAVLFGIGLAGIATTHAAQQQDRYASGHIIVKPRDAVSTAQFVAVLARHSAKDHSRVHATNIHLVDVTPGQEQNMVQELATEPNIEFTELDRLVDINTTTANDPDYSSAWHLQTIGAPTAWDTAKGNGVTVAVLDTGVDGTHPDLQGKLVPGWNVVDNTSNTADIYGHGTMVAGVIGAVSNNGIGVTSVAWNTMIMPVRVTDDSTTGSAYISSIANGVTWAADHGANIANASYAPLYSSPTMQSAGNYMLSKGGLLVVAAGNSGVLDSSPNTVSMIPVSATGSTDTLTSWSSYGPYVDVSAPGAGIWTTTMGGGYAAVSGTSFSSPMTAAVLALEKSANSALSNTQLQSILENTAVDLGTPGYDQYYGYGRINAAAAVAAAAGAASNIPPVDTQAPTVSIASPTGGTVSGTVTVSVNATDNVGVTRVDLYAGSTLVGSSSTAPSSFAWNTTAVVNGAVNLVAYAYDAAGNKGTSVTVTVTVSNVADTTPPTVSILNPAAGSTVSGTVSINISAGDNVGVISLSLSIDGVLKSSTAASSLSYSWNTRKVSRGTHTISATAKDAVGNSTTRSISVTH